MAGYVLIERRLFKLPSKEKIKRLKAEGRKPTCRNKDDIFAAGWLIANAVWQDKVTFVSGSHMVTLRRGQCCFSVRFLAEQWEESDTTTFRRLKHFEDVHFLRSEKVKHQVVHPDLLQAVQSKRFNLVQQTEGWVIHPKTGNVVHPKLGELIHSPLGGEKVITLCNYKEIQSQKFQQHRQGETPDFGQGETPDFGDGETPDFGAGETPDFGDGETPFSGGGETPCETKNNKYINIYSDTNSLRSLASSSVQAREDVEWCLHPDRVEFFRYHGKRTFARSQNILTNLILKYGHAAVREVALAAYGLATDDPVAYAMVGLANGPVRGSGDRAESGEDAGGRNVPVMLDDDRGVIDWAALGVSPEEIPDEIPKFDEVSNG